MLWNTLKSKFLQRFDLFLCKKNWRKKFKIKLQTDIEFKFRNFDYFLT